MQLRYTILYVVDPQIAARFYEKAFGLCVDSEHDGGAYVEMSTGGTTLAFASEDIAEKSVPGFRRNRIGEAPAGIEVGFVTDNVEAAYNNAVKAGALPVLEPVKKPWGQTVSYVRDLNGCLVEICSPVGA